MGYGGFTKRESDFSIIDLIIGACLLLLVITVSVCAINAIFDSNDPNKIQVLVNRSLKHSSEKQKYVPINGIAIELVIDTSGSMTYSPKNESSKTKIEIAKTSALSVVNRVVEFQGNHKDKNVLLGIVKFSSGVDEVQSLRSPNLKEGKEAISKLNPGGGTNIGDAILYANEKLQASCYTQKFIILISDGENSGGYSPSIVTRMLSELNGEDKPIVFVIGFDIGESVYRDIERYTTVLSAADSMQLNATLDYVLEKKILLEE